MINVQSEASFDDCDESNIPVDIHLTHHDRNWYVLEAANYQPRHGTVTEGVYRVDSESLEELQHLLRTKVLPLYRRATAIIEAMAAATRDVIMSDDRPHLYYWL